MEEKGMRFPLLLGTLCAGELKRTMNNVRGLERLISRQWPKLKKKAQDPDNPEELIATLEEIDDLLCLLERGSTSAASNARSSVCDLPSEDSESESQ